MQKIESFLVSHVLSSNPTTEKQVALHDKCSKSDNLNGLAQRELLGSFLVLSKQFSLFFSRNQQNRNFFSVLSVSVFPKIQSVQNFSTHLLSLQQNQKFPLLRFWKFGYVCQQGTVHKQIPSPFKIMKSGKLYFLRF